MKQYKLGRDNKLEDGEVVNFTATREIHTRYGLTVITAANVSIEDHVGRTIVMGVQPPERLKQFDKDFIQFLGNVTAEREVIGASE